VVKIYGASVQGSSHIITDTPCHDSHAYRMLKHGLGVVASVSDGMGSAKRAELGSTLAANFIVDYIEKHIDVNMDDTEIITLIKEGYVEVLDALHMEATSHELHVKDLNATLLVFLSIGDRQFYGQVGDCSLIGKTDAGYLVLAKQQRGEYANATFSICNEASIEQGLFEKIDGFYESVALMSDGIESISVSAKDQTVSKLFYDPFFNVFDHENFNQKDVESSLIRFLSSERISNKTDDDKTLLFVKVR
jgi:hypothetical protein